MKQPMDQMNPSSQSTFPFLPVTISALLVIVVAGGVLFWQMNQQQQLLNKEIVSLRTQIDQWEQPSPTATSPTPTTANADTAIYQNTTLGFQLTLPNESWYTEFGNDPHLYATQACAQMDRPSCAGIEVQNQDNEFAQGVDATVTDLKADGQSPVTLASLIPGAVVVKSAASGPAEGWDWEYHVFFTSAQKKFLILTNDASLEQSVISSFTLLN